MSATASRNSTIVRKLLRLAMTRARFTLGGVFAPKTTADRAARLFATPFASSRSRAGAVDPDPECRRHDLRVDGRSIATYVWGDPAKQPYALFAHGWSSFGLRF